MDYALYLSGGDLRSTGNADALVTLITTDTEFNKLVQCLGGKDRVVVMRAADAIEKITRHHPGWLAPHKGRLLSLLRLDSPKELKWHLSQIITRFDLEEKERLECWEILSTWARDAGESRIVRVNAIQALHDLSRDSPALRPGYANLIKEVAAEQVPSINARIRKLGLSAQSH